MKSSTKFNEIYQKKLKKCLVIFIGIFLCLHRPGTSAGGKCGRPGRTAKNIYEPRGDEFNENDKIHYKCIENNHIMLGNPERRCLRNGSWTDDIPVCSKVALFEMIELMFHDAESEDQSNYTVDGDISTCSQPSMFNRTIWRAYMTTSINVYAVRISFVDMKGVDIDVYVQKENSQETKRCKLKSDDEGTSLKSIKTLIFYCPVETIGKYVHISCNNLPLAFCEISVLQPPVSACLSPDTPLHGNGIKKILSKQSKYSFTCHEGYKAWGTLEVTCQTDGRWLPKSPVCEEIYCPATEIIENGYVEYSENKGRIPYNGTARFSCKEGFYLSGKPVIRCYRWQTWASPPPICIQRAIQNTDSTKSPPQTESWRQTDVTHCGNLPQIANGALIVNSSHVGSTAWLKCSPGFRPLTDDHVLCLSTGKWSLQSLRCTTIQCAVNPIIPHGEATLLNNSSNYGSYLQIKCNQGYASRSIITRKCGEYGSWGDLNVCVEITCGALKTEDVSNGQWLPVNGSTSLYVIICPENFHIEGSPAVIRCLSNGSWSYTAARCQKSFTTVWGGTWTPSLVLISAVAAGVATAVVILCLSMAFLVIKKRRQAQTNTTVFQLENAAQKDRIRDINSQRQKHHSVTGNHNTVELRSKSVSTFPRKPRSELPNLPVDADPVYAQPFETDTAMKKTSVTSSNKKDDLYNTHIYAEPVDSRRHTQIHTLGKIDNLRMGTNRRLSGTTTNLENELYNSVQTVQQNCDKMCAIYDSSGNSSTKRMTVTKDEYFQSHDNKIPLGTLKKHLEYMELL